MRSIEETVVLITGATDGLGRGVAERLALDGATVLLHGRDRERVDRVEREIRGVSGNNNISTYVADFASLEDVRNLAGEVLSTEDELHVLINNAGIGSGLPEKTTRQESREGYELRFAVNYLSGFLLTWLLLPLLRRSAPARIVNVASAGQSPIDFDDVMLERNYSGTRAYSQSKLAQIMFGIELGGLIPPEEVTINSLHPSTYMPTKIVLEQRGGHVDSLEDGVEATVRLAISPEVEGLTGGYYDRQSESRAMHQAYDPDARRRLWSLSLDLVGESQED